MLETPTFSTAAVAAPHSLAAQTGQAILAQGGNAVEATIAMAATLAVVSPHMNGIGGDGFWLVREPGGRAHGIDGCGVAGALATIKRYRDNGYDAVPPRGPDAALTVAGTVAGWQVALDLARSRGGKLPLRLLLGDAIRLAREGYPVSGCEARASAATDDAALHGAPGFAATFLAEGKPVPPGQTRRAPALSDTLEHLAHAGLDDFYRGDVAREIAADLERIGSPVTRPDLRSCRARVVAPLAMASKHGTLYNLPPPTQGLASLLTLGIFERLGVREGESAEHHHGLVEATKRAVGIRNAVVTDPGDLTHDPAAFLAATVLEREAARIERRRAAPSPPLGTEGAAVWMGAIDSEGLAVSSIQSLSWEFGSGCVLPATGILWQNRGLAFSLDPASSNPLQPGRKPFHTLNPAVALFNDGRVLSYGSTGGDAQTQFQAQIFTRYADFGMGLADAVDAPRWILGMDRGAATATLKLENRFDPSLIRALRDRGHDVEELTAPYRDTFGHAGMLVKHRRDGRVEATHDPRSDGTALGL